MSGENISDTITNSLDFRDNAKQVALLRAQSEKRELRKKIREQARIQREEVLAVTRKAIGAIRPLEWLFTDGWSDTPEMRQAWPQVTKRLQERVAWTASTGDRQNSFLDLVVVRPGKDFSFSEKLYLPHLPEKAASSEAAIFACALLADLQARLEENGFLSRPQVLFRQSFGLEWQAASGCKTLLRDWHAHGMTFTDKWWDFELQLRIKWNPEHY